MSSAVTPPSRAGVVLRARTALAAAALALLVLPLGAQGTAAVERVTLRGDAALYDLVGTVRIVGAEGSGDVVAEVTRSGRDAARLQLATGPIGGRETLRIVFPGDRIYASEIGARSTTRMTVRADGTFGGGSDDRDRSGRRTVSITGDEGGLAARADVVLRVPKGRRVAVYLAVGEAMVTNVDGDVTVDVANAKVTTSHTRGRLCLDTGSGDVSVTDADGALLLDTGSGRVMLEKVRGSALDIDAGSGNVTGNDVVVQRLALDLGSGRTRLSGVQSPRVMLDTGSGDTDLSLAGDVEDLRVDSGSGDVTLRLPATLGARVEVDAGSGGIDSELTMTVTRRDRSSLTGQIGDGRGAIRIESGSGTVRLLKR